MLLSVHSLFMLCFLFTFKFYEQYDDDEIGALDNAELEGSIQVDSSRLEEVLNDYYKEKAEKYGDFSLASCLFSFSNKVCNRTAESQKLLSQNPYFENNTFSLTFCSYFAIKSPEAEYNCKWKH